MTTTNHKTTSDKFSTFISITFKGIGQIMLQENVATGVIFLAGIFIGSVTMGLAALLATVTGTVTAILLGFDKANTEKGLYGFSAALVGVALLLFFKPVLFIWVLVVAGGILACIIQHLFLLRQIPVFTLPFVLVTWMLALIVTQFFPDLKAVNTTATLPIPDNFTFALKGFGQVIFQSNVLSGLLFFVAVFISSPIAALYGLAGAVFSAIISVYFSAQPEAINLGLLSYNAVLCAIVFAGIKVTDGIWALAATLISCVTSALMAKYNFMELTFPFVAATFITLQFRKLSIRKNHPAETSL